MSALPQERLKWCVEDRLGARCCRYWIAEVPMNIVDPIFFHCKYNPLGVAICAPGQNMGLISYGRLQHAIRTVSSKGVALGLTRGSIVAVLVEDRILDACIVLGLARIGVITLQSRGL